MAQHDRDRAPLATRLLQPGILAAAILIAVAALCARYAYQHRDQPWKAKIAERLAEGRPETLNQCIDEGLWRASVAGSALVPWCWGSPRRGAACAGRWRR
ncbi:MAG: hypothetical protein R3F11_04560 [Verrucomicrobiales bacterium]